MRETEVVTAFLRHEGDVLLLLRSPEVGSYAGLWGAVSGHADGDPDTTVVTEIAEETGIDAVAVTLVRAGDPFEFRDGTHRWRVYPFLFDSDTRDVSINWETSEAAWVAPTEILGRDTVPELWTSYDRVRPTVESIAMDNSHGSAYISRRALEVLRDEAALAWRGEDPADSHTQRGPEETAQELLATRPAMTAVANRLHRVMSEAEDPTVLENVAHKGIKRAIAVERDTAIAATELIGDRVATHSQSGTVRQALEESRPELLLVSESRPGREGIEVAESFAADSDVVVTTDAAFAGQLEEYAIDTLVVGADTVLPDGRVVNKVGTRSAASVATHEGIQTLVLASTDKISPDLKEWDVQSDTEDLYSGDSPVTVSNPTFETTPPSYIDSTVTEDGPIETPEIEAIATAHRQRRGWLEES